MKLLARTLLLCAATSFSLAIPALADEQMGAVSYDEPNSDQSAIGDMLSEGDLLAILPADALSAVPGAPMPGQDEAVGAEGPGGGPGGEHGRFGKMHHAGPLSGANALTDDQFEKLYALRNAYMNAVGSKMPELGRLGRELKEALLASDIDTGKVNGITSRMSAIKSDISAAKTARLVGSAQVLTADQRKALRTAMVHHSAMSGLPGMGGGHHGHHHHH
jgi:Spy/CpxP family protein refolding chaperone